MYSFWQVLGLGHFKRAVHGVPCGELLQEKAKNKKRLIQVNGELESYVIMGYWSRPAVGIKQTSDGKQALS